MSMRLTVCLSDYDDCPNQAALQAMLDALTRVNRIYLHHHPDTPDLYSGIVHYAKEDGREEWCDIGECIKRGGVDCEDLACWRAAELQLGGADARAVAVCESKGNTRFYHIVVRIVEADPFSPEGVVILQEDPSEILGMRAA